MYTNLPPYIRSFVVYVGTCWPPIVNYFPDVGPKREGVLTVGDHVDRLLTIDFMWICGCRRTGKLGLAFEGILAVAEDISPPTSRTERAVECQVRRPHSQSSICTCYS